MVANYEIRKIKLQGLIADGAGNSKRSVIQRRNNKILSIEMFNQQFIDPP